MPMLLPCCFRGQTSFDFYIYIGIMYVQKAMMKTLAAYERHSDAGRV